MLVRTRREAGMQRNDRRAVLREVQRDGVFTRKPLRALSWAIAILHDSRDERVREP